MSVLWKQASLQASYYFSLNFILFLMVKMNIKQSLFHSWKIRPDGGNPLQDTCSGALQMGQWGNVYDFVLTIIIHGIISFKYNILLIP